MEVTRDVLFDLLPELELAIEKASFISIDGEFTGIDNGAPMARNTPWDPPEQVYRRQYQKALDFLLIQYGMCIFNYDKATQKYTHQAYNFYVFPQCNSAHDPDSTFRCQSSSLAFLAHEGFDFNKLFRKGISYLSQEEEDKRRKALEEKWKTLKSAQNKVPGDMPIPEDKEKYLKDVCDKVKNFLAKSENSERLSLAPSNPYIRRLIYQEVEKEFGDDVCLRTEDKKDLSTKQEKSILVFRGEDKQSVKNFDEEAEKRERRELEEAVGFSHVVKLLSKSGKLIVGHNMLLDVCHTVNRFVQALPDDYQLFKEILHRTFPRMIDTKVMTSLRPFQNFFQSTTLQTVFETLCSDPFKVTECDVHIAGRGYSTLKAKEHEAGYDAYLTGLCFLTLCDYLKVECGEVGTEPETIASDFLNKVYIWVSDAPYINFGTDDPKTERQHVFHVEYPHEWKRNTLSRLFKSAGSVNVSFLDEKTAYVAVLNKSKVSMIKGVSGATVTRYDKYHSIQHRRVESSEVTVKSTKTQNEEHGKQAKNNKNKNQNTRTDNGRSQKSKTSNAKPHRAGNAETSEDSTEPAEDKGKEARRARGIFSQGSYNNKEKSAAEKEEEECFTFEPPSKIPKIEFEENNDWD